MTFSLYRQLLYADKVFANDNNTWFWIEHGTSLLEFKPNMTLRKILDIKQAINISLRPAALMASIDYTPTG